LVPTETVCLAIVGAETFVCTSAPNVSLVPWVSWPAYDSVPVIADLFPTVTLPAEKPFPVTVTDAPSCRLLPAMLAWMMSLSPSCRAPRLTTHAVGVTGAPASLVAACAT
jgi:hypothetical protein